MVSQPMEPMEPIDLSGELPVVQKLTAADVSGILEELAAYHAEFAHLFKRPEQRLGAEIYLRGLLTADVPRKNVEAMVLRLFGAGSDADRRVRALQQFIGESPWDDQAILALHHRLVGQSLGEADGVFILDGSDFPKQGRHSVGVARQWCGATGKKDPPQAGQAGVFLGYASRKGYTLLDRRLYLPASWFDEEHQALWQACQIPTGTEFRTKPELAAEMVEQLLQARPIPGCWVACDEGFGDNPRLLDRVTAAGLWYLAEVAKATTVWPLVEPDGVEPGGKERARPTTWVPERAASGRGRAPTKERVQPASPAKLRLDGFSEEIAPSAWQRFRLLEGAKGPLVADFVAFRALAVRNELPGPEVWVLIRRKVSDEEAEPKNKFYLSNAPADTPLAELVRVAGMRWPIESAFEEAKGELGLDQYELRFWRGWHHHMTLTILAHHFLVRLQRLLNQREGGPKAGGQAPGSRSGNTPPRLRSGAGASLAWPDSAPNPSRPAQLGPGTSTASSHSAATVYRPGGDTGAPLLPAAPQGCLLPIPSQTTPPTLG